jgi:RNA-directed DNA polymerase
MRGWAPYHQHGASKRTCATVAHHSVTLRWQWAQRRHPHPSRWWIKEQYCRSEDGHHWGCFGHVRRPHGKGHDVRLFRARRGPMRRQTNLQGEANPSAPQWAPSGAARSGVRMARHLPGRRQCLRLGKAQEGLWAVCQQRLTQWTGWHSQHLVWRPPGGSDRAATRGLRHPNGHAQVPTPRFEGVTPCPQRDVRKA